MANSQSPPATSLPLAPPSTSAPYSSVNTRLRAPSAASYQSTDSIAVSVSEVSAKRQDELERYFGAELRKQCPDIPAQDLLTVIATQSGDLQAKVLLHGRLYLTSHHLCFRSNILGYKTETIHSLADLRSVKKGTTAKWIQNAVYIIEDHHGTGDYIGYGSLADRDALYASIVECWKFSAPQRYAAWVDRASDECLVESAEEGTADTQGTASTSRAKEGEDLDSLVSTTQCTGEDHLSEVALDTVVGMPLEDLYNLVYHNREFMEDFYTNDKGLTG